MTVLVGIDTDNGKKGRGEKLLQRNKAKQIKTKPNQDSDTNIQERKGTCPRCESCFWLTWLDGGSVHCRNRAFRREIQVYRIEYGGREYIRLLASLESWRLGNYGKKPAAQGCFHESICFRQYGQLHELRSRDPLNSCISSQVSDVCGVRGVVFLIVSGVWVISRARRHGYYCWLILYHLQVLKSV